MPLIFSRAAFAAINPKTLKEFYSRVLGKEWPSIAERGKLYEELGLGLAGWYTGTADQNMRIIRELRRLSQT